MIKNMIFDMGNVLMSFSPEYILSHFTQDLDTIKVLKESIFYSGLWASLDNGDVSFDDACEVALKRCPMIDPAIIKELFSTWYHYKIEDKSMTELVKKLKEHGYKIYLCSNAAPLFHTYKDTYDVFQYFDGLLISGDINISKPDKAIYEYLLNHFDIIGQESLFIDDSLANIQAASSLGIHTFHYTGSLEAFKKTLHNLNLLP
ncbi:hypothetical protein AOC36_08855 [Erysipelothrix larvae]|uniref:Haloacid dehalogenase n=1 Tax=Erysipelothrix larvae TaxID=1514105 RepID=A0A109UHD0_9FIRM|nr:HAD family phosphatase [Erysipelothrix larvae]AMC94093.1 hypothetical protein AOC36_08855 [Erysipelothrix larvae]